MNLLRRNFGIAEPLRRGMELKMVREADSFRPSVLGTASGLHEDILTGRDDSMTWEDVYQGQDGLKLGLNAGGDGHDVKWTEEMEKKVGMESHQGCHYQIMTVLEGQTPGVSGVWPSGFRVRTKITHYIESV
ncbi:hypothetical protein LTS07_005158 [Exophiala sideris]|uniref:Uncharacterized protein n=1 Tax=Exophiala sideris TaxID=1016849 RepID=A0ABR0JB98_9EURO|nr:hypothetical protein LTS07_005158 [Exophiala sideris]KAK5038427.1 hypothetical protein LTR13_004174 [Exophiala sideris]KAK5060310.1 hypothetical protein LTR69_005627 [Exophiala sideris]KAK5183221.1 hypothetical protein LTR44_004222 [Eurotiomycetes sp. CCFEE 6388]